MQKRLVAAALSLFATALTSPCAAAIHDADPAVEANFKITLSGHPGFARVYVLPIYKRSALFGVIPMDGKITVKRDGEPGPDKVGVTGKGRFVAFDVPPGNYQISSRPYIRDESASTNLFHFNGGEVVVLRPIAYANGADFGLIGAGVASLQNGEKPQFAFVPPDEAQAEIKNMSMSALDTEAPGYVSQQAR